MLNQTQEKKAYTGILQTFYDGKELMAVLKTNNGKVFAKFDSCVPINLFYTYYVHAVIERKNGRNVMIAMQVLAESVNKTWLERLDSSVLKRSKSSFSCLLLQVMVIEEPVLRDLVLEMLCDKAILPILQACMVDYNSDGGHTIFESLAGRVNENTEIITQLPAPILVRDALCVVSFMQKIINHAVIIRCVYNLHGGYTPLQLLSSKLIRLPERCMVTDMVLSHLVNIKKDEELIEYLRGYMDI